MCLSVSISLLSLLLLFLSFFFSLNFFFLLKPLFPKEYLKEPTTFHFFLVFRRSRVRMRQNEKKKPHHAVGVSNVFRSPFLLDMQGFKKKKKKKDRKVKRSIDELVKSR
ncbi:hypothetical protein HMI54_004323 [Coelomomyces lativittatus]|nr:hypothetical protein HMI54_004323 [Coelomomyces lativittatus]